MASGNGWGGWQWVEQSDSVSVFNHISADISSRYSLLVFSLSLPQMCAVDAECVSFFGVDSFSSLFQTKCGFEGKNVERAEPASQPSSRSLQLHILAALFHRQLYAIRTHTHY